MSEPEKRKGGGAKVSRSETVSVRFDPRLRWLAEIAARIQRRSVSSYIEAAVEQNLHEVLLEKEPRVSVADNAKLLWKMSEAARLARLSRLYPHLLTHEEEKWVRAASQAHKALGIMSRDEDDQVDDLQPYWEFVKKAASDDLPTKDILAGVMTIKTKLETGGPVTVERIDKRIDELNAKHKADVAWLLAKKRELEGVSDDAETAETAEQDGIGSKGSNTVGSNRRLLGNPNATASARLGLGDPNTAKPAGLGVRLGQPKPKATK